MDFADVQWVVFHLAAFLLVLLVVARRQQKRLERELRYQALHDPLTGLANRTLLLQQATQAVRAAEKSADVVPVLVFLDLDDFKLVNDTLGHGAGDSLLREIALRLKEGCYEEGLVARLGGDEFAVLFSGEDAAEFQLVAERLLRSVRTLKPLGSDFVLTASVGVAYYGKAMTAEELLRRADIAMYAAKAGGKGTVRVFDAGMDAAMRCSATDERHSERLNHRAVQAP